MNERIWRFGSAEFAETVAVLTIADDAVELDRNCAMILACLLEGRGAVVKKEQLLEVGWPGRIVHENSLAKAISRLRKALGEYGVALESVYGLGYRLVVAAQVESPADTAPPPVATHAPIPAPGIARGKRRSLVLLGAIGLLGLAVTGATILAADTRVDPDSEFRTTPPLTSDPPDTIGRILWVDDHPENNIYEERLFKSRRIAVHAVTNSVDALQLLSMNDYEVVISDMGRGEDRLAGIRLVDRMRAMEDDTPFIIYTIRPDGEEQQRAQQRLVKEAGAQALVVTPVEVRTVVLRLFGNPEPRPTTKKAAQKL